MTEIIDDIEPRAVFKYFSEICSIPHGSDNTEMISEYCVEFAKNHNLKYRKDECGNVIIWKKASKGYEDRPGVILQGHIDMVAVKNSGCDKNLEKDGLDLAVDGDWLYAKETSLGGDDGIAVAYALALLASDEYKHPSLEVIFTVGEEIGMVGASAIDLSDINGRILMNMDSEDEGIFLAGCAGGATVTCGVNAVYENVTGSSLIIEITGLQGGHSGTEIICQRANANVILGRILYKISEKIHFNIKNISGGEKDNAIAKFAKTEITASDRDIEEIKKIVAQQEKLVQNEYSKKDAGLEVKAAASKENIGRNSKALDSESTKKVIAALAGLPNGVCKMSDDIEGLVQTSLNLGVVTQDEDLVKLCYSVRSSIDSEKDFLIDRMKICMDILGGKCEISGEYPAWEYVKESHLRDIMSESYERLFGRKPTVETIHAGVECGIIADKIGGLDCVSFGPDIKDIHTTKERLSISSTQRTWKLILDVLSRI